MKKHVGLFMIVLVIGCVSAIPAPKVHIPALAKLGDGALLSAELIYPLKNRSTPQCHASTIAETPTGLVAAWFTGTREKHDDVGIRVSRQVDGQWTAPVEVADGSEGEDREYP